MADGAFEDQPSLRERLRERRAHRRQLRTWRKERRKGSINAGDAAIRAESDMAKGGFFSSNPTPKD